MRLLRGQFLSSNCQPRYFAAKRQSISDFGPVQLARVAVPGIGRPGDRAGRLGVADDFDRLDPCAFPVGLRSFQHLPDGVILRARGNENHGIGDDIQRSSGVGALGLDAALSIAETARFSSISTPSFTRWR